MADQEMLYHVMVRSKRGYEHDDEDAWMLLQEKRADILAAGAQATFNRSFGGRVWGGVSTIITFVAPVASDPKKQVKPEQFFPAETDAVTCSITLISKPEEAPATPKAPKDVPNVAG